MSRVSRWIKSNLSRKPGFWFFQIVGWLVFTTGMKIYYSEREVYSFLTFYRFYITYVLGFLLTLGLRYYYQRILRGHRSITFIVINIFVASLIIHIIWVPIDVLVSLPYLSPEELNEFLAPFKNFNFLDYYKDNLFWYIVILLWSVLYVGLKFWIELIGIKEKSEKAALLAQKSQLQMLRYQLNPHFLFNSLNSIQALVYDDPEHADKMITELSDFLRFTIRDKDKLCIPLGEEVKIVEKYLSMEKTRFPDRLDYKISVTEQASKVEVIAFILQPFVENAVKHGLKSSPEKLLVTIMGYAEAHRLYLEVRNNGPWIENKKNDGVGIQNVFDRLQMAYPNKYNMHIYKNPDSVCILIEIYI